MGLEMGLDLGWKNDLVMWASHVFFERVLLWCRLRRSTPRPQFCSLLSFAFDCSVHNMVDSIYVFSDVDKHP